MSAGANLLSPERAGALERALFRCRRQAAARGSAVLLAHVEQLEDAPDGVGLFAAAEAARERRFYAARPVDATELVGIGQAAALEWSGPLDWSVLRRGTRVEIVRSGIWRAPSDSHVPPGPLWVGGIAFDPIRTGSRGPEWAPHGSASFVLPELILTRDGRSSWLTFIARVAPQTSPRGPLERWEALLAKPAPEATGRLEVPVEGSAEDSSDLEAYRSRVTRVIDAIRAGVARKVVVAHRIDLPIDLTAGGVAPLLRRLRSAQPGCLIFARAIEDTSFVGATPERLIRSTGERVESWAVAATTGRGRSAAESRELARKLLASPKEQAEHAFVVREIARQLGPLCVELSRPRTPEVLRTGTLQHLFTPLRGRTRRARHVIDLVRRLHPTPALGGSPRAAALHLIRTHENFDRGWYGGPIGWMDQSGRGDFFVALRCALLHGSGGHLYAGSGVLADSDPDHETAETGAKLGTFREALRTP